MKEHHPHHAHHEEEPPQADAARWRKSLQGQSLRIDIVENMGQVSRRQPRELAVETVRALMSTCLSAHQEQLPISSEDAKIISMLLSTAVTSKESHLADFADGKGMLPGSMREEISGILDRRRIYPEMREAANALGNHILSLEGYGDFLPKPGHGFQDMHSAIIQHMKAGPPIAMHYRMPEDSNPDEVADEAGARAENLALEHGHKALAHLRRPSVDVLADDMEERFGEEYIGSRRHPHQLIEEIAEARGLHRDDPLVREEMVELYEMTWTGREVHLFLRHEAATGEIGRNENGEWRGGHGA